MLDSCVHLHVGRETTPHLRAGGGAETQCEFTLEHENGAADDGAVGEEFEYKRGGDLLSARLIQVVVAQREPTW